MRQRYIYCIGFLIAVLLLWPLYQGKLWIIDDHEMVFFNSVLEKNSESALQALGAGVAETEITRWGQTARYRPVYYAIRVLKTYLFGINARYWFLWSFFLFFFSVVCVGFSINYFFPPPFVFSGMLLFAALPCHADIWGRLGPSEIDACLWTTLFIFGFARYVKKYRFAWTLMCLSAFMATGCKENFVLLLLPLSIVFALEIRKKGNRPRNIFLFICPLGMALAVWGSVIFQEAALPQAADVYRRSLSLFARARVVFNFIYEGQRASIIIISFVLFFSCCCLAKNKMSDVKNSFIAMLTIATCILGNFVFHNGETSLLLRYAYMEQLFFIVLFFAALFPLRHMFIDAWHSSSLFRKRVLRACCAVGFISVVSILTLSRVNYIRVQRTLEFDEFLKRMKNYDNVQIINLGPPLSSFEPYFSLKRFAEAGLIPKVYYFPVWAPTGDAFSESLKNSLAQDAAATPSPPLTPGAALVEFSPNGWFRFMEHSSSQRKIDQTILTNGWQEDRSRWEKFWGIFPSDRGRRSSGDIMALVLPVDEPQACSVAISAVPFDAEDRQSEVVFCFNGAEVRRTKLKDYAYNFNFEVSRDLALNSPLHKNLMLLETHIENPSSGNPNGLIFYSIDIQPLPETTNGL